MTGETNGRMGTRVSLVLELLDDFTNKKVTENQVSVRIEHELPALKKSGGYYVFTNLRRRSFTVEIGSERYWTKSVHIDLDQYGNDFPVLKIRLIPNLSYPIPEGTTCVEGRAEAGAMVRIMCKDPDRSMKLLHDYSCQGEHSGEIGIYYSGGMDLEEKTLFIENREKTEKEFFKVIRNLDENRYRISKKLNSSYKKIGTVIYPVYSTTADKNSFFFIPVLNQGREKQTFFCEALGNVSVGKECEFMTGSRNYIDLREEET